MFKVVESPKSKRERGKEEKKKKVQQPAAAQKTSAANEGRKECGRKE